MLEEKLKCYKRLEHSLGQKCVLSCFLWISSVINSFVKGAPGPQSNGFVIVVVFINIQLFYIIDESLRQGFPNQINEAFTKLNMFVMQQSVYSSEYLSWYRPR